MALDAMQELQGNFQKWQALREERLRQLVKQEEAKRHHLQEMLSLPRRVAPRPSEDLASVIIRTAQAMEYPQPTWILRPQKAGHAIAPGELALLRRSLDYELLMRLLDLDEATLYHLTLHHFAEKVQDTNTVRLAENADAHYAARLSGLPRLWNAQQLFSYSGRTIRVCPCCLDEPDEYQRLYWRATPMLLCPRHHVWLIDSCPACQKPIPALRPQLSICPSCGGDYRQQVLPLAPEARWLRGTHCVFLTHLGIDAIELGESLTEDEPSLLRDLPSQDYFWIVTQFLEILFAQPYRERLLPLLSRALPVEELAPPTTQSSLLLLHYLLAYWPVHFWIAIERLQQALDEDPLWSHSSYDPAQKWKVQLTQGPVWDQEASREQTMTFLHAFFDMAKDYFQQQRYPKQPAFMRYIVSTPLEVAYLLRSPTIEELASPRPWEDLASVIGRVAHNMRYEHPDWVLISPDTPHHKVSSREIPLLRRLADYRALERTLGLDEVALYHMTLHRFASHLQSPKKGDRATSSSSEEIGRPLLSISTVRRVGVSLSDTKICLDCLEEEPGYDRLFWRLRPVILCTRHSLLLVDHCPNCSASIPGLRPSPGRCPYCRHGEYRQVRRESVSPSSWLHVGQTLLLHVLMAESTGGWPSSQTFVESPILGVKSWQYFALLERFENLLQPRLTTSVVVRTLKRLAWEDDQNVSASPTTREVAFQIALFHYLLASWPENLLTALDTVVTKMKGWQARGSMLEIFRQVDRLRQHIWSSSSYGDTAFDFILQVFETLFAWATISVIPLGRGEGFSHE